MPSKLEVISPGSRLARIPQIHMTVSGLGRAWQSRERERGSERGRYRQNQREMWGGVEMDDWVLNDELSSISLQPLIATEGAADL